MKRLVTFGFYPPAVADRADYERVPVDRPVRGRRVRPDDVEAARADGGAAACPRRRQVLGGAAGHGVLRRDDSRHREDRRVQRSGRRSASGRRADQAARQDRPRVPAGGQADRRCRRWAGRPLTFRNAAVDAGVAAAPGGGYRAEWSVRQRHGHVGAKLGATSAPGTRVDAPTGLPATDGKFVRVDVSAVSPPHPSWQTPVKIYFVPDRRRLETRGAGTAARRRSGLELERFSVDERRQVWVLVLAPSGVQRPPIVPGPEDQGRRTIDGLGTKD